ncbi:VanZ family protein [Agromyces sp. NPDC058484]|uniref:VanZ family protein n=1 Tax=Agromyces sp. NPDC058484 TaxID=3346524 RepID=UPI003647C461
MQPSDRAVPPLRPLTHRRRFWLTLFGGLYALALGVVLFWPTHVDGEGGFVRFDLIVDALGLLGAPAWAAYQWVEFAANMVLFAPLGVLWAAAARRLRYRGIATAALIGAAVSIGAEALQFLAIADRTTDARDIVANTAGAALGALIAVVTVRAVQRRRSAPSNSVVHPTVSRPTHRDAVNASPQPPT